MCNEQIVGWVTEWSGVDTPKTVITTKDPAVLKKSQKCWDKSWRKLDPCVSFFITAKH